MAVPIKYASDRALVERLLLDTARKHTAQFRALSEAEARELQRRHFMHEPDYKPRVYWRMTENWLELVVRFVARDRGVRDLKDLMSRDILAGLDKAGIEIASATFEIVGVPPLTITASS